MTVGLILKTFLAHTVVTHVKSSIAGVNIIGSGLYAAGTASATSTLENDKGLDRERETICFKNPTSNNKS